MTLVIATGGIDLSVGSLMAIAGRAGAADLPRPARSRSPNLYVAVALAIVVPIMVAGLFGLFNGWLITRFHIQPIIATLILFIAGRGIAQVLTNGNLQVFKHAGVPVHRPRPPARHARSRSIMLAIVVRRRLGAAAHGVRARRCWRSAATRAAARLSGVPVDRVKLLVYVHLRPAAPASPG